MHLFQRRLIPTGLFRSPSPPSGTSLLNVRVRTTTCIMTDYTAVSELYRLVGLVNNHLARLHPDIRPTMTISGQTYHQPPHGIISFTGRTAPESALQKFLAADHITPSTVFLTVATPPSLFRQCTLMQIKVVVPAFRDSERQHDQHPAHVKHPEGPLVLKANASSVSMDQTSVYDLPRHQVQAVRHEVEVFVFSILRLLGQVVHGDVLEVEGCPYVKVFQCYSELSFLKCLQYPLAAWLS
jgi:hypothetical protein